MKLKPNEVSLPKAGWIPNKYQKQVLEAFCKFKAEKDSRGHNIHNGVKVINLCWRRQLGKTRLALLMLAISCFFSPGARHVFAFNTFGQAFEAVFENETYLEVIPKEMIKRVNLTKMVIEFTNGSYIKVVGMDRGTKNFRGWDAKGIVIDEYAFCEDETAIPLVFDNMLNKMDGWMMIVSTPNGLNDFHSRHMATKKLQQQNPSRYFHSYVRFTESVGINGITKEKVQERYYFLASKFGYKRAKGIIRQEYFCSWDASAVDAIWGEEMENVIKEGRLTDLRALGYPDQAFDTHVAYDLGRYGGDETVAIAFQIIPDHENKTNKVLILDCYAAKDQTANDMLHSWVIPNNYHTGYMIVPHDFKGVYHMVADPVKQFREQGIKLRVLPQPGPLGKSFGIDMARDLLRHCIFDNKCLHNEDGADWNLIEALKRYKGKYDPKMDIIKAHPDKADHWSDAFRYLSVGILGLDYEKKRNRKLQLYNTDGLPWHKSGEGTWIAKDNNYMEKLDRDWDDDWYEEEDDDFEEF